jgi:undecaprenyl-diphosphatase
MPMQDLPQPTAVPTPQERRLRRSALVLAAVSAALAVGFLSLSRAVVAGRTEHLDRQLLLAMREVDDTSDPVGPRWFEEACRDFTALGGVTVLSIFTVTVTAFFWLAGMHRGAVYVGIAVFGALVINSALKAAFDRPRPDLVPHGSVVYQASFPSGHSMLAATVYLTLGMVASRFVPRRRLKVLLIGMAFLVTGFVGASRVYLGVHWPTDVVAGWAVGVAWALLCWCVAAWLQDRGLVEQDFEHPQPETP